MAELIKIRDNHEGFFTVLETLFEKGIRQESRNGVTLEVEDLIIEVAEPLYMSAEGIRPGFNGLIGVIEGLQLLAGVSDSGVTADIQPQFRAYMDDGKFWGAYGPRTVDQLPVIVKRLADDPDTRQAVVTLWDPEFDAHGGKKDHPCTAAFVFQVRQGKLNMKTLMRSNDLWWGWPYDAVQFSMLQQAVASALDLPVGAYTHHAVSAHLYEPHWEVARKALEERLVTETRQPVLSFKSNAVGDVYERHDSFGTLLHRVEAPSFDALERWTSIKQQAFDTLGAVSGFVGTDKLTEPTQQALAQQLLERKAKVVQQNLKKVTELGERF